MRGRSGARGGRVMGHEPELGEVVTRRGDGLRFDADVMARADGEVGVGRPAKKPGELSESAIWWQKS